MCCRTALDYKIIPHTPPTAAEDVGALNPGWVMHKFTLRPMTIRCATELRLALYEQPRHRATPISDSFTRLLFVCTIDRALHFSLPTLGYAYTSHGQLHKASLPKPLCDGSEGFSGIDALSKTSNASGIAGLRSAAIAGDRFE